MTFTKFCRCACGRCFPVTLDPKQPRRRHRKLCDDCRAKNAKRQSERQAAVRVALTNELIRLGGPQIHSVMERSAERTCAEVGKILGCSKEQVRLLEHTALIKLMRKFKELQK